MATKPNFSDVTYLRICLFDNATDEQLMTNKRSFKLTVGVKKQNSTQFKNFLFAMNTKGTWVVKRGAVGKMNLDDDSHYKLVLKNYHDIKSSNAFDPDCPPRISKAYCRPPGQGRQTIPYVTSILWSTNGKYYVNLILGDTEWLEELDFKNLTEKERGSNMIAKTIWQTTATGEVYDWSTSDWV